MTTLILRAPLPSITFLHPLYFTFFGKRRNLGLFMGIIWWLQLLVPILFSSQLFIALYYLLPPSLTIFFNKTFEIKSHQGWFFLFLKLQQHLLVLKHKFNQLWVAVYWNILAILFTLFWDVLNKGYLKSISIFENGSTMLLLRLKLNYPIMYFLGVDICKCTVLLARLVFHLLLPRSFATSRSAIICLSSFFTL